MQAPITPPPQIATRMASPPISCLTVLIVAELSDANAALDNIARIRGLRVKLGPRGIA